MYVIKEECQDNARNMVYSQATYLGMVQGTRYYVLDGKIWSIGRGARVKYYDGQQEMSRILHALRFQRKLEVQHG